MKWRHLVLASVCGVALNAATLLAAEAGDTKSAFLEFERDLTRQVATSVTARLDKVLGGAPFVAEAQVRLDEPRLRRQLGLLKDVGDESPGHVADGDLPGLVGGGERLWRQRLAALSGSKALVFVDRISIKIALEATPDAQLAAAITDVVTQDTLTLTGRKPDVAFVKNANFTSLRPPTKSNNLAGDAESSPRSDTILAPILERLAAPADLMMKSDTSAAFFGALGLVAIFAMILVGGLLMLLALNRTVQRVGGAVATALQNGSSPGAATVGAVTAGPSPRPATRLEDGGESLESEIRKLIVAVKTDPELAKVIVGHLYRDGRLDELVILFGFIPPLTRDSLTTSLPGTASTHLKAFLRDQGYALLRSPDVVAAKAGELNRMFWLGAQDADSLMYHLRRASLARLDDTHLADLIEAASPDVCQAAMTLAGPARIASLIAGNLVTLETVAASKDIDPSRAAIDALGVALAAQISGAANPERGFLMGVANHLPQGLEAKLRNMVPQASGESLDVLARRHTEVVVAWLGRLSLAECAQALAGFENELRESLLNQLPEIKARRIRSQGMSLTGRSLTLKAELISVLRTTTEGQADAAAEIHHDAA